MKAEPKRGIHYHIDERTQRRENGHGRGSGSAYSLNPAAGSKILRSISHTSNARGRSRRQMISFRQKWDRDPPSKSDCCYTEVESCRRSQLRDKGDNTERSMLNCSNLSSACQMQANDPSINLGSETWICFIADFQQASRHSERAKQCTDDTRSSVRWVHKVGWCVQEAEDN